MATLILDMPAGIAGDMLLGALVDLGGDLERLRSDLQALSIGPIGITATSITDQGIAAVRIDVDAPQEPRWLQQAGPGHAVFAAPTHQATSDHGAHGHRPYHVIRTLIERASLPPRVTARAQRVFRLLAEAEGAVHGVAVDAVEFHEVGALDAIADVVGCCLLLEQLGIDRVIAGPVLPGEGSVRCAHGLMPVPVPAVAAMLAQHRVPHRRLGIETGELTTPTGCALVVGLADAWLHDAAGDTVVTTIRVGHGAGHKRLDSRPNVVRATLAASSSATNGDTVSELRCTIDDATGEALAVLIEDLLTVGALDAWLTPVVMKKGRPAHELTVLCAPADRARISAEVLTRSTSIGLRWQDLQRVTLPRRMVEITLDGQVIPLKVVSLPDGGERAKPEADAVAAASRRLHRPFAEVAAAAVAIWRSGQT